MLKVRIDKARDLKSCAKGEHTLGKPVQALVQLGQRPLNITILEINKYLYIPYLNMEQKVRGSVAEPNKILRLRLSNTGVKLQIASITNSLFDTRTLTKRFSCCFYILQI